MLRTKKLASAHTPVLRSHLVQVARSGLCHLNTPTTTKTKMGILYLQHFAKVQYIIGFDISQIIFKFLE